MPQLAEVQQYCEHVRETFGVLPDAAAAVELARNGRFPDWTIVAALLAPVLTARAAGVVGLSGSQGSGKSTLAGILAREMGDADVVSLDDFYLPRGDRETLAREVHPLLATRGVPGTHDHAWLRRTLRERSGQRAVPVFDKGLDDRTGERTIGSHALVFEGWCLGLQTQSADALREPVNELERTEDANRTWRAWVNGQLHAHYQALWDSVDFWVHLRVPGFAQVLAWRREQEQALPVEHRMSEAQLQRFIAHYERWTRHLWATEPLGPGIVIELNAAHRLVSFRCRSVAGD